MRVQTHLPIRGVACGIAPLILINFATLRSQQILILRPTPLPVGFERWVAFFISVQDTRGRKVVSRHYQIVHLTFFQVRDYENFSNPSQK
ncbi:hypothetical protein Bxe_B2913 [Paraburkholderia xenovorans LB400]|uniref:Uncharacterized protein n=1 Tax=Paraburkholderia xenovorans (strain LB400) TaxID=266265 RepID=Q13S57_PARXL|nr:hypothetical protein Bxe_B2913 [Paraburkholderia xenovorans LB400]